MRILITGAGGFLGSHLTRHLAATHEVTALVRRLPSQPIVGVHYVTQDLSQPLQRGQLPARLDAIIHQAALIHTERHPEALAFQTNVIATWDLLKLAAETRVQTFVHASTGGVYGSRNQPFVETDPLNPMDLYSITKAQAELAVQAAAGDFRRVILRYFFPYGLGTPNPIPLWVQRALRGEPLEILASGKPRLNPLHISDAVEATIRALALETNATLNIAGREITTFAEIAALAAHSGQRQPNFVPIPDEQAIPYYRADIVGDTTQMERVLRFQPTVDLATGIGELVAYYRSHEDAA